MSSNIPLHNTKQNPKTASQSCCCERHIALQDWYLNLHLVHRVQDPAHRAVTSTDEHPGWVIGKKSAKLQGFDGGCFSYIKNLEMKEKEKLFLSSINLHSWDEYRHSRRTAPVTMCLTRRQTIDVPYSAAWHWPCLQRVSLVLVTRKRRRGKVKWLARDSPNNYVLTYKFNPTVYLLYNTAFFLFTRNQNVLSSSLTSTSYFILDSSHPLLVQLSAHFWKTVFQYA